MLIKKEKVRKYKNQLVPEYPQFLRWSVTSKIMVIKCPLCNEEFESDELLQKHMITHDNV